MVFHQFQQAENEEYQSKKKWNRAVGIVAAGSNGTVMNSENSLQLEISLYRKISLYREIFAIFAI